jgi:Pyruvate/2-oxoacid:ferredoxin oxidoreductase delta subunit
MIPGLRNRRPAARQVVVNYAICHFCGACVGACLENCLFLYNSHLSIDRQACSGCERCVHACPLQALSMTESQLEMAG